MLCNSIVLQIQPNDEILEDEGSTRFTLEFLNLLFSLTLSICKNIFAVCDLQNFLIMSPDFQNFIKYVIF